MVEEAVEEAVEVEAVHLIEEVVEEVVEALDEEDTVMNPLAHPSTGAYFNKELIQMKACKMTMILGITSARKPRM
jgi:hypothetical protein